MYVDVVPHLLLSSCALHFMFVCVSLIRGRSGFDPDTIWQVEEERSEVLALAALHCSGDTRNLQTNSELTWSGPHPHLPHPEPFGLHISSQGL
jgi:hypothetical protein